jgi:site-specific recombinase XerD
MFDQLFSRCSTRSKHVSAPFAEERSRYLEHCTEQGDSCWTVLSKAHDLLWFCRQLNGRIDLNLSIEQVRALIHDGADREGLRGPRLALASTRIRLIGHACAWLRYLGSFSEPIELIPYGSRLDEYRNWALQERGLTAASVACFGQSIAAFLRWFGALDRPLDSVNINDVDAYLTVGNVRGWSRVTQCNVVYALRAFFRFGEQQKWCSPRLATTIRGPRIYALERLPAGPTWSDVQRLLAGLQTSRPTDIRDRAILMLFAIYGFRASEVATLRLDDIDWAHDRLRVARAKRRESQIYPLLPSVGKALIEYLQSVRHITSHREVFLTVVSPYRPLSCSGLYDIVSSKLKALNVQCPHRGPHSLRHACATRLISEGVSLKEIGDHLGHRSTSSTRVYANVDLSGLREVAAFDLGELS